MQTQIHKHTNPQRHNDTNTQIHKYTNTSKASHCTKAVCCARVFRRQCNTVCIQFKFRSVFLCFYYLSNMSEKQKQCAVRQLLVDCVFNLNANSRQGRPAGKGCEEDPPLPPRLFSPLHQTCHICFTFCFIFVS